MFTKLMLMAVFIASCSAAKTKCKGAKCTDLLSCWQNKQAMGEEVLAVLKDFRFGEIYGRLNSWCPYRTKRCLHLESDNKELVSTVAFVEEVLEIMCKDKRHFKGTSCYEGDFQDRMIKCTIDIYKVDPNNIQGLKNCISNALDELPGCTSDHFFFQFFKAAHDLMGKLVSILSCNLKIVTCALITV